MHPVQQRHNDTGPNTVVCTVPGAKDQTSSYSMNRYFQSKVSDSSLKKEGVAVLATIGFGERQPPVQPHRFHGIAARSRTTDDDLRKSTRTIASRQQPHRHHKERSIIHQVGEISAIAREVSDFTTAGQRVPPTVWEKYDRLNKRHKKEEGVVAIVTKTFNKKPSGRDDDAPASAERVDRSKQQREEHHPANNSGVKLDRHGRSQLFKGGALGSDDHRAGSGGNHYACTFGSGRCDTDLPDEGRLWPKPPSGGSISSCNGCPTRRDSSWGRQERQKLNELYWDLGRPPRGGDAAAVRDHFARYTQRHRLLFPRRSPREIIQRLALMFRFNMMKEPNEDDYWYNFRSSGRRHSPSFHGTHCT